MSELGIATSGISKGALEHHDRFRPLCRSTRVRAYRNLATPDERSWRGLGVLFGDVVLEDADGGGPFERSVGSVVIVEVDESFIGAGALDI